MTEKYELSRRKALAALGTIGAAGAGAGLGTSAFFSDQETFSNNKLVAGELDLHVGWEEHYSDWSDDENDNLNGEVQMVDRGSTADSSRVGLPLNNANNTDTPLNGTMITVNNVSEARQFLNNTEPSTNPTYSNATGSFDPETLDPANACQYLEPGSEQSPVIIDLGDVKPGDFGEVTFSLASCTNPAFLWMNGSLVDADENGTTEPEAEDTDELDPSESTSANLFDNEGDETGEPNTDPADTTQERVELLDEVQTALWYDDGDNLQSGGGGGGGGGNADVVLLLDDSGSVGGVKQDIEDGAKTFVDILGAMDAAAAIAFASSPNTEIGLTTLDSQQDQTDVKNAIEDFDGTGSLTDITEGLEAAETELNNNGRQGAQPWVIAITDGQANTASYTSTGDAMKDDNDSAVSNNSDFGINIGAIGFGSTDDSGLTDLAGRDPNTPNDDQGLYIDTTDQNSPTIQEAFSDFGGTVTAGDEEVFFTGTLREALAALANGPGVPLAGDTPAPDGGGAESARNCFAGEVRHDVGFAWWLPVDHANEIQSDSVTFDLGFYAEQCRHNDGTGMANRPDP